MQQHIKLQEKIIFIANINKKNALPQQNSYGVYTHWRYKWLSCQFCTTKHSLPDTQIGHFFYEEFQQKGHKLSLQLSPLWCKFWEKTSVQSKRFHKMINYAEIPLDINFQKLLWNLQKSTYIYYILLCLCWQICAQSQHTCEWHSRHSPLFAGLFIAKQKHNPHSCRNSDPVTADSL